MSSPAATGMQLAFYSVLRDPGVDEFLQAGTIQKQTHYFFMPFGHWKTKVCLALPDGECINVFLKTTRKPRGI